MKKRSLFMVIILLMFGLNLEAKNLTSQAPKNRAVSSTTSQRDLREPAQIVLKVPVDIFIPKGLHFQSKTSNEILTTSGKARLWCQLIFSDNTEPVHKFIPLNNGSYTAEMEFRNLTPTQLMNLDNYLCTFLVSLEGSSKRKSISMKQIRNLSSYLAEDYKNGASGTIK